MMSPLSTFFAGILLTQLCGTLEALALPLLNSSLLFVRIVSGVAVCLRIDWTGFIGSNVDRE
jgi:hypothetical protein